MNLHSSKVRVFRAVAFALCFFVSGFFVSKCFAESGQKKEAQVDSSEYIRTIAQIFYTLQSRFVEEVDPEVLYKGALDAGIFWQKDVRVKPEHDTPFLL